MIEMGILKTENFSNYLFVEYFFNKLIITLEITAIGITPLHIPTN